MPSFVRRLAALRRRRLEPGERPVVPLDPRLVVSGPLDPALDAIRASLQPHRRRLWLRRIVRRAWVALAVGAALEAILFGVARVVPLEVLPSLAVTVAIVVIGGWLAAAIRSRPSIGEAAIALDAEARLGDRVSSALSLAAAFPALAGPAPALDDSDEGGPDEGGDAAETERFVRRQRVDALAVLRVASAALFRPRLARRPAAVALMATLLMVPLVLLPNPQDQAIADARANRDEARKQADHVDQIAKELESKGVKPNDPRTRLALDLRDLAAQLRSHPEDLKANLARLGSVEEALHSQLDAGNETRSASLTSLNRSLSRAALGKADANKDGDPKTAADDLAKLGEKLGQMTEQEKKDLAAALSGLQSSAAQASGSAGQALRDAAQAISQGDTAAARDALNRLGDALETAGDQVQVNRDLARAASQLQDTRRALADASRNVGQTGQAGQSPRPGQSGQPGQGGQPGQSGQPGQGGQPGQSGQPGQGGQPGQSGQPGQGGQQPGQGGQQPGQGGQQPGQGGQQPGQGGQQPGQGPIGGGGSRAASLGQGMGGSGTARGPVNPNRPATLGPDLSSVADFQGLGKPGDPSYVAGIGGDGQTQQGNQTGQGQNNGAGIPYQQVFADFYNYALTSLDRNYVPLSVKDYVRDYFSSLDPKQ
jgi:hypothetical protein